MKLRSQIFKGAAVLTGGQVAIQALSFIRNMIVARLLNPENMGIAATFAITITLLEMISNLAVDMVLVQAKDGDDPVFQETAQSFQVLRGILIGLLIFVCAPIITTLFKIPDAEWAFRLLGVVPLFRGFMHLDWKRLQRKLQYHNAVFVELIPQVVITLAAYPMAIWLKDYSTVLWLVLMQSLIGLFISHLFSERSYRLRLNREYGYRIFSFGWPLLFNGLLMFGAVQGDRLIVGTFYSMAELGVYSVSFSIMFALASVVSKLSTSLLLPIFARLQNQRIKFRERYLLISQIISLTGACIALPFIIAGGDIIVLFFGKQYSQAFVLAPWLALFFAFRVFRLSPTIAALACGDTKNSMYANLYRLLGIILAVILAWYKYPISYIIGCGVAGEMAAFLFSAFRLDKLEHIEIRNSIQPPFVVLTILLIATGINIFHISDGCLYKKLGEYLFYNISLAIIGLYFFKLPLLLADTKTNKNFFHRVIK